MLSALLDALVSPDYLRDLWLVERFGYYRNMLIVRVKRKQVQIGLPIKQAAIFRERIRLLLAG